MPPKNYRVVTVRVEVYERLLALADKENLSLNDMIKKILHFYLRHVYGERL